MYIKQRFKVLWAGIVGAIALLAANPAPRAQSATPDIVDIAVSNPDFSTLVTALQTAGLVDALKAAGPFTVFAPNNAAFAKLPPGTVEALLADPARLSRVLLYHVAEGRRRSTDLTAGKLVTLQGAAATVDLSAGVKIDASTVIAADIEAANGVIHVVDTVLLPPGDIVEIALANPDFSTLVTALQTAGLVDALKTAGPFTVFAPNNAAFAKLPPGTVEALLADPARLSRVLLYHVAEGRRRSTDLTAGKLITLQGAAATVDLSAGVRIDASTVIAADVEAANGVIHVVDTVLLPPGDIVEIALANPDFSTLVTALQTAGLVDALKAAGPFTVFAPNNAAFAKLPPGTVEALLADPARLSRVLLYHVAEGRRRSTDLTAGKLVTLQGAAATVDLSAGVRIDTSTVIAADIEAANGVIHVVDTVLLPPGDIVEIALANPDFSTLVTALQTAGLVDALKTAGPFTVFAPNNAAFAKLPPGTVEALLADPARLSRVLLYHVAEGRRRSTDLTAGKLITLQGAAATVDLSAGVRIDASTVIAADVEAANGVIHVVDTVLLPPGDIVEIALANPDFSTLVTALQTAGLVDALKAAGPFTVFAPNNAAFAKLPPGTVEALLADPARLSRVLLYHVAEGRRRSTDLTAGKLVTLQGAAATVDLSAGVRIDTSTVIAADIEAANGVIHVVDTVLLPPGDIVEIALANPDFSTLVTALETAGLVDALKAAGPFTVFAPNNAAFAKLPPGTVEALLADPARLSRVLLYHVARGRERSTDLTAGKLVTLQGAAATVDLSAGVRIDTSTVIAADIEAANGVIHVVDTVLLPPGDIVEIALANPDFSTLVTALQTAGLVDALKAAGPYTVFAPNNAAFARLPAGTLDALLQNPAQLREVLLYHVVHGPRLRAAQLGSGNVTTMQGSPLRIQVNQGGVLINQASVISADIEAGNGVIHVIDQVVLPADGFQELTLTASVKGSLLTLVWPSAAGEARTLEVAETPSGPWSSVEIAPTSNNGVSKVELEASAPMRFFRVVRSPTGN